MLVFDRFWLFLPHYKHIFPIFLIYNAVIPTSQRTLFITLPVVSKLESTNHLSSTSNPFSSSMSASVILMAPCPRTASPLMGSPEARCGQHPSRTYHATGRGQTRFHPRHGTSFILPSPKEQTLLFQPVHKPSESDKDTNNHSQKRKASVMQLGFLPPRKLTFCHLFQRQTFHLFHQRINPL